MSVGVGLDDGEPLGVGDVVGVGDVPPTVGVGDVAGAPADVVGVGVADGLVFGHEEVGVGDGVGVGVGAAVRLRTSNSVFRWLAEVGVLATVGSAGTGEADTVLVTDVDPRRAGR